MDQFWEEFEKGEIHFRDKWQFELKSEFAPIAGKKQSGYSQEFFIFIPAALQINSETYSQNDFFRARTNLIHLVTPEFTFQELLDLKNPYSPLTKLKSLQATIQQHASMMAMEQELKLFANVFRGTLRNNVYQLIQELEKANGDNEILQCKGHIQKLLEDVHNVQTHFSAQKKDTLKHPEGLVLLHVFEYIQDVMSISLNSSLSSLLEAVRHKAQPQLKESHLELSKVLLQEKEYREKELKEPEELDKDAIQNEAVLYQSGLLNKFILDALQLKTQRQATDEKFRSLIGSFAAGTTMLLYLSLFIWQGAIFVINSLPFVLFTVLIYIVKDRIKDELKSLSFKHVFKWFPDYTTKVFLPDDNKEIGKIQESFSFVKEDEVPIEVSQLRNQEFHSYLEMIKRQEKVISYKKKVIINESDGELHQGLNIIFRYDIHNFLIKGSNAYEPYVTIDRETLQLTHISLPKVYHINIILKNRFLTSDDKEKIEYKKFRLVVDKEGIKRVESLPNGSVQIEG